MDRGEAREVLTTHLGAFRVRSYGDLVSLIGDVQVAEVRGPSGAEYQIEVDVSWASPREKTNVRVWGTIDDGRLPGALSPVGEVFIVAPDGKFVGE